MFQHYCKYLSNENLKNYLQDKFEEWDKEDEVTYSAWVITDRIEHSRVQRQFHLNNLIF